MENFTEILILLLLCAGVLSACGQAGTVMPAETEKQEIPVEAHTVPEPPVDSGLMREDQLAVGEETYTIRRIGVDAGYPWDPVVDTVKIYRVGDLDEAVYTADNWGLSGSRYSVYGWEDGELVCLRRFEISVDMYEPPYEAENRFYVRRDGELRLEGEWRGTAGVWGDSLVAPEAEKYRALTLTKEGAAAP